MYIPRPIWQGAISFGLVTIPIKMYSAVNTKSIKFKLVHKKDKSPIKYKRYCEKEGKEVDWKDIIKALEISKGRYYFLEPEELEKLKPEKTGNLDILEFVSASQIDPIYFNTHYYLVPAKSKEKAYFLFRKVLQTAGKIAIARIIMRDKEYICVVSAYKTGMLLSTLNYQYEIKDMKNFEELRDAPSISTSEMQLAEQLIEKLTQEELDMTKFKDTFEEQLKKLIAKKEAGEIVEIKGKTKKTTKEENLLAVLKASLKK
jgi:DNA end-binding protein Ku